MGFPWLASNCLGFAPSQFAPPAAIKTTMSAEEPQDSVPSAADAPAPAPQPGEGAGFASAGAHVKDVALEVKARSLHRADFGLAPAAGGAHFRPPTAGTTATPGVGEQPGCAGGLPSVRH